MIIKFVGGGVAGGLGFLFVGEFVFSCIGVDEFVFEEFAEAAEDFFGFFACFVGDFLEG